MCTYSTVLCITSQAKKQRRKNLESTSPPLSTSVYSMPMAYSQPSIAFVVDNVAVRRMRDAERNVKRTLQRIQQEPFDLNLMHQLGNPFVIASGKGIVV